MPIYKDKERGTYYYYQYTKTINGKKYQKKARGFKTKNEALIAEIESQNNLMNFANKPITLI